jgi:hypothetical protein
MRRVSSSAIFLCILVTSIGCTMWHEHAVSTWSDATGGEGLERSFWKEVKAKSWKELEKHLASNYICVSPDGRLDRTATLEHIRQLDLGEYSLGDFQVELHGNVLIVTYAATMRGTLSGQALPDAPIRIMTIWQQQKTGWVAIAQTGSEPRR